MCINCAQYLHQVNNFRGQIRKLTDDHKRLLLALEEALDMIGIIHVNWKRVEELEKLCSQGRP